MGEKKEISIDNIDDTLEKYILSLWPDLDLENSSITNHSNHPLDLFEKIKNMNIRNHETIIISGFLQFLYGEEQELVKIENFQYDQIGYYIEKICHKTKLKWNLDAHYVDSYLKNEKLSENENIFNLNINKHSYIELRQNKQILINIMPQNKRIYLGTLSESLQIWNIQGKKIDI
jgi:hypothetical protein